MSSILSSQNISIILVALLCPQEGVVCQHSFSSGGCLLSNPCCGTCSSQGSGVALSLCLKTIRWLIQKAGFFKQVADTTSLKLWWSAAHFSSGKVAQDPSLVSWEEHYSVNPCKATFWQLASFFHRLRKGLKLLVLALNPQMAGACTALIFFFPFSFSSLITGCIKLLCQMEPNWVNTGMPIVRFLW